jgi:threonine synthase
MSAYGARADLPGFLCAATNAPREKLQSLAPYGVTLLSMADIGLPEMNRIAGLAIDYQLQLAVTVYRHNPERMRGAEAIGVELIDQGPFTHICVPTGGGGLLAAIAGGLASSAKRPVVVCARPQGYAQISLHVEGEMREPEIDACTTAISGLQLPYPPDRALASAVTRESGGWGCPVSDEEAWETQAMLFQQEGIFVEPASALAHAAIQQDLRTGGLTGTDRPIAVLTGTGLKDLRRFSTADQGASTAVTLDDHHALLKATFADGAVSESGALPKNERSR